MKPSGRENPLFWNNPCLPNSQINFSCSSGYWEGVINGFFLGVLSYHVSVFLAAFKVIMLPGCCPRGLLHLINSSWETGLPCRLLYCLQGWRRTTMFFSLSLNVYTVCLYPHVDVCAWHRLTQDGNYCEPKRQWLGIITHSLNRIVASVYTKLSMWVKEGGYRSSKDRLWVRMHHSNAGYLPKPSKDQRDPNSLSPTFLLYSSLCGIICMYGDNRPSTALVIKKEMLAAYHDWMNVS